jgi:hypothetical protein
LRAALGAGLLTGREGHRLDLDSGGGGQAFLCREGDARLRDAGHGERADGDGCGGDE